MKLYFKINGVECSCEVSRINWSILRSIRGMKMNTPPIGAGKKLRQEYSSINKRRALALEDWQKREAIRLHKEAEIDWL